MQLGAPIVLGGIDIWKALVIEVVLTFFLVWVIFASAADPRGSFKPISGLAIGLTITIDGLVGGPLTGAAMNPARAFGPDLVQNFWTDWWIYYVGPVAGAVIAALIYEFLYLTPTLRPLLPVGAPEAGVDEEAAGERRSTSCPSGSRRLEPAPARGLGGDARPRLGHPLVRAVTRSPDSQPRQEPRTPATRR